MSGLAWGAIVTLGIFVGSNIAALIWYGSKFSTLLEVVQRDLHELTIELKAMKESYLSKESFAYHVAVSDKEHVAMWREIDRAKTRGGEGS